MFRTRLSFSSIRNIKRSYNDNAEKPFDKILIANRGEIACRIIRTCKRLGVKTVAVYSDADYSNSMHVSMADEAHYLGGNQSKDSYLRMDRIIDIAKKTGAQAIHPGYGFLSENAKFVDLVESSGIAFIGPSSGPMRDMGDKINSKRIAKEAGVNTIPGFEGEVRDAEHAVQLARDVVGYPVMMKASAGGGGKGMRVAYNDDDVREGFLLSKSEAMSSFGDDRMLMERYIENPHHIEIQVLADSFGNVVAFPERECSVQRRNQKVVEESPSCLLTPETRLKMQKQAIALCQATGYRSAGTVEMLADDQQNFFFLEMNTRLQVEHPITELVSGEDLVEHMLWVAAGKALPAKMVEQQCLPFSGSAIESRVYAEDPIRNFLPSIGPLTVYREPQVFQTPSGTVRIDTGVREGQTISMFYDPMISKLCTHSSTREKAIQLMETAIDQYVVQGLGNNLCFLRSVFRNPMFRTGHYSTSFIGNQYPDGFQGVSLSESEMLEAVAVAAAIHDAGQLPVNRSVRSVDANLNPSLNLWDDNNNNNNNDSLEEDELVKREDVVVTVDGKSFLTSLSLSQRLDVKIRPIHHSDDLSTSSLLLSSGSNVHLLDLEWLSGQPLGRVTFSEDRKEYVQVVGSKKGSNVFSLRFQGAEERFEVWSVKEFQLSKHMLPIVEKDLSKFLVSPMPGTLISVGVSEGQNVEEGQQLAVVEAMKMQNVLRAAKKGQVKKIHKQSGQHLKVDEVIVEFS